MPMGMDRTYAFVCADFCRGMKCCWKRELNGVSNYLHLHLHLHVRLQQNLIHQCCIQAAYLYLKNEEDQLKPARNTKRKRNIVKVKIISTKRDLAAASSRVSWTRPATDRPTACVSRLPSPSLSTDRQNSEQTPNRSVGSNKNVNGGRKPKSKSLP